MKSVWPAPAKLNLFLHILGRRPDGYHNLQTVFQFIDYCDELRFTVRQDNAINLHSPIEGVADSDNLIVKAARLLQQTTHSALGADIFVEKKIPMGGGLGGGSSNAATTLVALNTLWDLQQSNTQLQALGLTLGADIPVFVAGHAAWAEGVGEKLLPITLPEPWYVIIKPSVSVPTAKIFSDPQLTRNTSPFTIHEFSKGRETRNDFEIVVCKHYPEVAAALEWLNQFAEARLTGSGSCIFAAVTEESIAQQIVQQIPAEFFGFYAKALNKSPLKA